MLWFLVTAFTWIAVAYTMYNGTWEWKNEEEEEEKRVSKKEEK